MKVIEDAKNVKVKWDNDIYGLNDKRIEQFLDHDDRIWSIEILIEIGKLKKDVSLIYIFVIKLNIFFNLFQQVCSKIVSSLLYHPVYINIIEEKERNFNLNIYKFYIVIEAL